MCGGSVCGGSVCGALGVGLAASAARYIASMLRMGRGVDVLVTGPLLVAFLVVVVRTLVYYGSAGDSTLEARTAMSRMRLYLVVAPLVSVSVWPACAAVGLGILERRCRGNTFYFCALLAFVVAAVAASALHIAVGVWGFNECHRRSPAWLKSTMLWRTTLLTVNSAATVATPCVLAPLVYSIAPSTLNFLGL
jgi:hypothetical protein